MNIVSLVAAACMVSPQVNDRMWNEADEFRMSLDVNASAHQASALESAIEGDIADFQAIRNGRNAEQKLSEGVEARYITENMRLYEHVSSKGRKLPVLIYLHGGGWCMGSINSCAAFCDAMAATGKLRVVAVNYRLAPENPYPDGLNDCVAAIDYVKSHAEELDVESVAVGGDSSGGNLALASALSRSGDIDRLLLFYPVTKGYNDGSESWRDYASGFGLDGRVMDKFNKAYRGEFNGVEKLIDIADIADEELLKLPETLMIAAGRDILRDQGIVLAERCDSRRFRRVEFEGAVHLFITVPGQPTAFSESVRLASGFIASPNLFF